MMDKSELLEALRTIDKRTDASFRETLLERTAAELEFHDSNRDEHLLATMTAKQYEKTHGNSRFYLTSKDSTKYLHKWIREHSPGRIVLDYACGNGGATLRAAEADAELAIGLDISPVSIDNCRRAAASRQLTGNTFFLQGDCENTGLPDNSVDIVICSGMLHHLDLSYAFPELRRIMKPGGTCLCVEALSYNPLIKLYRKLTPKMRTEWEKEHILSLKHIAFAKWFFEVRDVRYWHLLSLLMTPLRKTRVFRSALALANMLDSVILRVPILSLMAWQFTFVLVKEEER